jgi:hypothetical protein
MATGTCRACRLSGPLAQTRVYGHAPGAVVRCPGCEQVLFTIVAEDGRYWLGFDRLRCLEIGPAGLRLTQMVQRAATMV